MKKFEHNMTFHPVEELGGSDFVCSEDGVCDAGGHGETATLKAALDEAGAEGWELVQLKFGRAGVLAFWKREAQ